MADVKQLAEQLVGLTVKEGISKADAEALVAKLKEAGADVEMV